MASRSRANKARQGGQALVEALIGLPALIALLTVLVLSLSVFALRLHLIFLAQELASCRIATKPRAECERLAAQQTRNLLSHWGFHDISIKAVARVSRASLSIRAIWGQDLLQWSLRWKVEESLPFRARPD